MADSNVVAAKITADVSDFKAGMLDAANASATSLDQITSQLSSIRGASNQTSIASTQMSSDIKEALESIASMAEKSATRYNAAQRLAAVEEKSRADQAKANATTIAAQASVIVAGIAQEMESTKQLAATYKAWAPVQIQLSRQAATEAVANSKAQIAASQATIASVNSLAAQATASAQAQVSANASVAAQTLATSNVLVAAQQKQAANYKMLTEQSAAAARAQVANSKAQASMAQSTASQAVAASNVQVAQINAQVAAMQVLSGAQQSAASASGIHTAAVGLNSTAIRELLVVMREFSRGDTTRMAGSLSILAQQFQFTKNIIASIFTPAISATIVAVAALGAMWLKGKTDAEEFANAMQISGNAAGFTRDSYESLVQKLQLMSRISSGEARTSVLALATAGKFTAQQIEQLTESAVTFGRKTGQSTEDALKKFIAFKDGATKGLKQLIDEGFKPVDAELMESIKHLEAEGREMEALQLAINAVNGKLSTMADNTNSVTNAWQKFKSTTSGIMDVVSRAISGELTNVEKLANVYAQIDARKFLAKSAGIGGEDESLNKLYKERDDLIKLMGTDQQKAAQAVAKQKYDAQLNSAYEYERGLHLKSNTKDEQEQLSNNVAKFKILKDSAKTQQDMARYVKEEAEERDKIIKSFTEKPKKEKGAVTQSQVVRGELLDYLNAHEQAAIDMHKIYTKRLQDTLDFYTQEAAIIRGRKGATAADVKRVDNQVKAAKLAMDKEAQTASITAMQDEIKDRSKGYDEQIRLAKAFEAKLFDATAKPDNAKKGEFNQSKQYYDAQKERKTLEERGLQESLQIQQEEYKGFATIELEKLDDLKASYKIQLTEHQINLKAYLALMRQEASDELKIKEKLIDDEIALERQKDGGGDLVKIKALENQKLLIERQSNKELVKNSQDAAKDYMKPWDDAWKHMTDSFSSNIEKVIKRQQNLGQAFRYTLGDMVLYGAKASEKIAIDWIKDRMHELIFGKAIETQKTMATGIQTQARIGIQAAGTAQGVGLKVSELPVHFGIEQAKTGATVMGEGERVAAQEAGAAEGLAIKAAMAIKQIAIDAYTAFAGAYAAIAAIPYVGPVLAPVAAGVAFAGVIAAGRAIASAEGGYDIPHGVNPVTQLHQDEMVLPAPVANTVRSAMNGSTNAAKRSNGDTHIHMNIHTPNPDAFRKSATQIQRETKRKMASVG